jgi:hypothetical protein
MFLFGKKKKNTTIAKEDDLKIRLTVIPEIFYGGKDPLVYHEQKEKKIEKKPAQEKHKNVRIVAPFSKKKVIVIAIILLGLAGGTGAWYYLSQTEMPEGGILVKLGLKESPKGEEIIPPGPQLPLASTPEPALPEPTPSEPAPSEPVVITPTQPRPLTFPRILLSDSPDLDIDSLTDLEEELFNTDSGVWDTDQDGYYDGLELSNLYNPTGFAPVKLVDSGLVREYINPTWKYRTYYPGTWAEASVDSSNDHILFSSITGDFIEIRAIKNELSETFDAWFTKNITEQSFTDLSVVKNRFGVEFIKRNDSLVSYFVGNKVVFVVIYQPSGDAESLPFRHVMQMVQQSFRLGEGPIELPEQNILPVPTL